IRDYKVTGVQTCALPISGGLMPKRQRHPRSSRFIGCFCSRVNGSKATFLGGEGPGPLFTTLSGRIQRPSDLSRNQVSVWGRYARSEERRVGKEGRRRGWG